MVFSVTFELSMYPAYCKQVIERKGYSKAAPPKQAHFGRAWIAETYPDCPGCVNWSANGVLPASDR